MKKLFSIIFFVLLYLLSTAANDVYALAEFPIATTSGREVSASGATDGISYLVGIQGDASASNNITAQLVSASTGALVGSRISIGRTGSAPTVAFDGTNYLMVWADDATKPDVQYGQLISRTGSLVGSPFSIGQSYQDAGGIIFDGINYFVVYEVRSDYTKGDTADIYGQFITPSGTLLGSAIPVSTAIHGQRSPSLVFDGTKIIIVWADGRNQSACYTDGGGTHCLESDTYGQFVTKSSSDAAGALSGANFPISLSSLPRDASAPTVAFDGTRYLVTFPQETTLPNACPGGIYCKWDVYGQFVTTAGAADGSMITISNTTPDHHFPFVSWNGNLKRYLVTWTENIGTSSDIVKARYFTVSGSTLGNEFVLFSTTNGLIPLFAGTMPTATGYAAIVNRGVTGTSFDNMAKDVFGAFFSPFAKSDFNSDGKSDLIWRNTSTGQLYYWLMDGLTLSSSGYMFDGNPVGVEWRIDGIGDLNSDGKSDLIWRNTNTGQVYYWLMNGLTLSSSGYLYDGQAVDLQWQIAGVGDLNSDGNSDIIWRNTSSGQLYYWLMDGLTLLSSGYLYDASPVGLEWRIDGIYTLNTVTMLLWRNTSTGQVYLWFMEGLNLFGSGYLYGGQPVDLQWQIAGVADMNADSIPDIIWRNTSTGTLYYWLMNSYGNISSSGYLYDGNPVGLEWDLRLK